MRIFHIATEVAPVAKVGGLGDVLLGLTHEQVVKGHTSEIIIPKYDCIDFSGVEGMQEICTDLMSYYDSIWYRNSIWSGTVRGLKVYFIDPHHPSQLFRRGLFYGAADDVHRFLYFSRAALEFLFKKNLKPDIIHLHDWQTAAMAPLYYDLYKKQGYDHAKVVFTIHNIAYQGLCASSDLAKSGLLNGGYLSSTKMGDNNYPELINLLKGGVVFSDYVTTVSPKYAEEVLTPEGGRGLESTLIKHKEKFVGILNGIDYDYWNPETDPYLPEQFSSRSIPKNESDTHTIDNKSIAKTRLRKLTGIKEGPYPIVSAIARLVPQKGIDLIKHALVYTLQRGGQFVLIGSSPDPAIQSDFERIKKELIDHPQVHLCLRHNEEKAHLLYAGSDILVVPSLFEPCGLTQMIALRYGTIPVVRKTGGLAETVIDVKDSGKPFNETNGFVFEYPDRQGLEYALGRALDFWEKEPDKWQRLMINGMKQDFSWGMSANKYLEVYNKVLG